MKTKSILLFILVSFISTGALRAQFAELQWNTFLGSGDLDAAYAVCSDSSGNVYVTGISNATWGTPVNSYSGDYDVYVAAMDSSGNLLWNTFLGTTLYDYVNDIALDGSGNIYVAGWSQSTWGTPINAHSGSFDAFVAKLDSSGNLLWNTFMGSYNNDYLQGMALDGSGNIYIVGYGDVTWGTPVNAHSGGWDIFAACLNSSGVLQWNTFLGSGSTDQCGEIAVSSSGNVFLTGHSNATWGSPVNAYSAGYEAVVVSLDSSGNLVWNTFLGSSASDKGKGIALDSSNNIYVTGESAGSWGSPINAYTSSGYDGFAARLDSSGNLVWNTFLGNSGADHCTDIITDSSGNVYVAGYSSATWGSPVSPFSGSYDAFAACLYSSGIRLWNTFVGSGSDDYGWGIFSDNSGNIYLVGESSVSWGTPVTAHSGGWDAYVVKLKNYPIADIKANGSDGPVSITESYSLQIRVSLNRFGSDDNVDYWLAYRGPSGWVHYNNSTKKWEAGLGVTHQGSLMDLNNKKVFQSSGLVPGNYTFYFGVDMNMDGKVTKSSLYKDEVQVTVNASSN
jgi:hypothetical protein